MQVFGGKGVSSDIPLASMYGHWRAMRLADGPEEVHMYQLGRNLLKAARGRKDVDTQYFHRDYAADKPGAAASGMAPRE